MTNNDPWNTDPAPVTDRPSWMTNEIEELLKLRNFPIDENGMLMLWKDSKDRLDHYKELEMEQRKICAAFLVPEKTEGTVNVPLGNGYQAKVVHKYNYKPKDDNDTIWAGLEKIEKLGNEGPFIAKRLFSWTPNFLKSEYIQLQEDAEKGSEFAKAVLKIVNDELIVISEAAPTVSIVEPKAKKK